MNSHELLNLLHKEIPISKQMGISVFNIDDLNCILRTELKPNHNHKGTAFGGSIYSVCALSSYGLFLNGLQKNNFKTNNIVISEGQIKYLSPVTDNFEVVAQWSSDMERKNFFIQLQQRSVARVKLSSIVYCQNKICAEFVGNFVAKI